MSDELVTTFGAAVERFNQGIFDLQSALAPTRVDSYTRARLAQLGMDLVAACGGFRVAYEKALDLQRQRFKDFAEEVVTARPGEGATREQWAAHGEAMIQLK